MFRFKQFVVRQEHAAMKVGTDGVLLGAWVGVRPSDRRVLDIGTGTGVMALMTAQRSAAASVVGVEIDALAAADARCNILASPWADRVTVVESDIKDYRADLPFDLALCNPPYYDASLGCADAGRNMARHTVSLDFGALAVAAERLLGECGRLAVIVPYDAARRMIAAMTMPLRRRCDVRTKPGGMPRRTLLEFERGHCGGVEYSELSIGDGAGGYDCRYVALTRDFYLKF